MFHFFQTVSSFFRPLAHSLAYLLDEFGIIVVAAAVVVFSLINSLLELFTVAFFYRSWRYVVVSIYSSHMYVCVCRCCRHCCCCCFSRVFFPSTEPFFSRVHFLLISSIMRYIVRISCLVYLVKRLLTVHLAYGIRVLEFGFEFEFGLMSLLYISYPPLETVFRVRIIRAFYLYMCVCVSAMVPLLLLPLLLTAVVVGSIQSLLFTF